MDNNTDHTIIISRYLKCFEIFKRANIVNFLYKESEETALKKWLFRATPIICYTINLLFIITANAFWNEEIPLSFVKDMSNSFALSILYFVSYFLSYYFPSLFDKWLKCGIDSNFNNNVSESPKLIWVSITMIGLIVFGFFCGKIFCDTAMENGYKIWINYLNVAGKAYYMFFLGIIWYQSLSVLGMALSAGFFLFWCIKDCKIIYEKLDYNKNLSITNAIDIILCTFSYGLFYIVGAILFILNDKIAAQEPINVKNMFYDNVASLILIVVVLLIVIVAYIPLNEIIIYMRKEKEQLLAEYNQKIQETSLQSEKDIIIEKRNELINQPLIMASKSNKILIILSVLIPLIGVIFQGMDLLK